MSQNRWGKNGKKFDIGKLLSSLPLEQTPQTYKWAFLSTPLFAVRYVPLKQPFQSWKGVINLCFNEVDTLLQTSRKSLANFKGIVTFSDI